MRTMVFLDIGIEEEIDGPEPTDEELQKIVESLKTLLDNLSYNELREYLTIEDM